MKESTRFIRFTLVGTLNFLLTLGIYALLRKGFDVDYKWANAVGYLIGQINSFLWSKYWIYITPYNKDRQIWKQTLLFVCSSLISYAAQFAFMYALIEFVGVNEYLAQFLGLFVYGGTNYLFNRYLTFR